MKYLQASKLVREADFTEQKSLLLASSGQTENLDMYLRAEFALQGIDCRVSHIPFNTLEQELIAGKWDHDLHAVILMPWDFLPSLDWRTGIAASDPDPESCIERIERFGELLRRKNACYGYLDAPIPPLFSNSRLQQGIGKQILARALENCGDSFDASAFNLAGYLENGVPIAGNQCGPVAARLADSLLARKPFHRRLLVSDLDNVMWQGVIGEDGVDAIHYSPPGKGYMHYLYQCYLKKIKNAGILLAAVSKNDPDLACLPFSRGDMLLDEDDLVTIQASYYPKSTQIRNIAQNLNLPLDAFVFVDDNPIEIEEVNRALPEISTLLFPAESAQLPGFFDALAASFDLRETTDEDRVRTALYRTRLEGMAPTCGGDADLLDFLHELSMKIRISDRSSADNERALQLFNKTNQFNINGRRIDRDELDRKLENGYRLYTAALSDRHGEHGEILACMLDRDLKVELLVMSCRVFERRIEHYFIGWMVENLLPREQGELHLDYSPTERNTPVSLFLQKMGVEPQQGRVSIDAAALLADNAKIESLFDASMD